MAQRSRTQTPSHHETVACVLVVDDDPGFLRYASRVLQVAGYSYRLAQDLESARGFLSAQTFDVMVLDLHLPDGNGIDLLRSLGDVATSLPVIVATGQPSVATAVQAMRLDVLDYLVKPEMELEAAIERAIGRFRRARQGTAAPLDKVAWAQQLRAIADYLGTHEAPSLAPVAASAGRRSRAWDLLSRREAEVARGLMQGHAPAEIAVQLGIGLSTVRNHIQAAYRRLGVRTQLELIAKLRDR